MVERTRSRPIPSGQVSVQAAAAFLLLQALVGLAVLLQFNRFTIWSASPRSRRGGLSVHEAHHLLAADRARACLLLGRADGLAGGLRRGSIAPALLLYAGSIAWVIGYDTIYAHQDREDDALIGIKSTALLFGEHTKPLLALFYAVAVALLALAAWRAQARAGVRLGLLAFAAHLAWQMWRLRHRRPGELPCGVQIEPRRRADPVRGVCGRCADRAGGCDTLFVIAGLDPAIHLLRNEVLRILMDPRVKPGGDA